MYRMIAQTKKKRSKLFYFLVIYLLFSEVFWVYLDGVRLPLRPYSNNLNKKFKIIRMFLLEMAIHWVCCHARGAHFIQKNS